MKELRQLWDSLPSKAAFGLTLGAWCLLFHVAGNTTFGYVNSPSMFGWLTGWYRLKSNGESGDELAPFIPFLVLALLYLKRTELLTVAKRPWAPALVLVVAGLALHAVGFVGQQVRISVAGFIVGVWGLMGLFWGFAWLRATLFPWFVLMFAIPIAAYTDGLTFRLRLLSTQVSVAVCNGLLGLNLVRQGDGTTVLHLPTDGLGGFQFDVAPACSGIRSASVVLLLTVVYAFLNFRSPWRRLLVVACSVPFALFGNIIRLTVVFTVGEAFGEDAGKMIETNFGFITYLGALAGIFALGWALREPMLEPPPPSPPTPLPPGVAWNRFVIPSAVITLALVGATFALLVRVRERQTLGAPAVRLTSVPLISPDGRIAKTNSIFLPRMVPGYEAKTGTIGDQEIAFLPPDTSFGRLTYHSAADDFSAQTSVVLMGHDRTSIHQPDFCLTGAGWTIQNKRYETIPLPGSPPRLLPVRRFDAQMNYRTPEGVPRRIAGVYVFWFAADGEVTASHWTRTWSLMRRLLTDGVLQRWAYVSYFAQCEPGQEDATYERLKQLIVASVPQFQRFEVAATP